MNYKGIDLNDDDLIKILESIGLTHIKNGTNEIKFSWSPNSNPNGSCLFKKTLRFVHWSENLNGDLIDLIQKKTGYNFIQSKKFIEDVTNKQYNNINIKEDIYREYIKKLPKDSKPKTYPTEMLYEYPNCVSKLFLDDGIGLMAHYVFDIRFDSDSNRILIPIRNIEGNLLGVLGRYNQKDIKGKTPKYLSILQNERKHTLFGIYENKKYLSDTIILVESEKSVMRAFSMGYRNVLALGGVIVNKHKLKLLMKLKPKKVILSLDEGISRDYIVESAKELKSPNPFIKWHVGFIDSNNIGLGKKNCIFDESKDKCKEILSKHIEYIC